MAAQWFCQISDSRETIGPLSPQQLRLLVEQGKLLPDHLVRQGESAWVPASRIKGLFAGGTPLDAPPASKPAEAAVPAQPPGELAPPIAVPAAVQTSQSDADRLEMEGPKPPLAADFSVIVHDEQPGKTRSSAAPAGLRRKPGGDPKLVARLLLLLVASGLGVVAVLFWPRSPADQPIGSSPAKRIAKTPEVPETIAPLESLEELADDVALTSAEEKSEIAKEKSEIQWTDATAESIRRGDLSVKILSAQIGRPRLARSGGRFARPTEAVLTVRLQLRNESQTRKLEYAGWGTGQFAAGVKLTDDLGNAYSQKSWKGATPDGQLAQESLYPGKAVEDILVFQKPVEKAGILQLRLPASAFGQKQTLDFAVPMSMVTVEEDGSAPPPAVAAGGEKTEEPLPPGRGVPAIERGMAEMEAEKPKEDSESILDIVNQDTEALGGGDQGMAAEADFEEMLRDRQDSDPARRNSEKSPAKPSPRKTR